MTQWRITAAGAIQRPPPDDPDDLRPLMRSAGVTGVRRVNRYIQLALIGARRCAAQLVDPLPANCPVYVASEQGNVAGAVDLVQGIMLRGEPPRPFTFINVSSNMAGFYIAAQLGLTGHNMTVSRRYGHLGAMLELAALDPAAPRQWLLGTVAECVWPLLAHRICLGLAADAPLVESSYWFAVDNDASQPRATLTYEVNPHLPAVRDWLAQASSWALDPALDAADHDALVASANPDARLTTPHCHRGNPDTVAHLLYTALQGDAFAPLRLVGRDPSRGYQLIELSP